jgi:2-oxoglutarate dehydrogenase E1 component
MKWRGSPESTPLSILMATITSPEASSLSSIASKDNSLPRAQVFDAFRRWGYLQAQLDPLGQYLAPKGVPELNLDGPDAAEARGYYCGAIAAEFMHIPDGARREWIQTRFESRKDFNGELKVQDQQRTLELLLRADLFEQVIQSRYLGTKRFSLEGVTVLIPFLDELLTHGADHGAVSAVIGMSHRGRLNVMVNIVGCEAADIFSKFEDVDPRSILGGGDVKYHVGATGDYETRNGKQVSLHLVSNPSHLEAVDPVAAGRARAKQKRLGAGGEDKLIPIVIHGDAAFAGQGVLAETMNLASIEGFSIGGTIHIVVNNLIGFTAEPAEVSSSRFATDVAKRLPVPIFHVNAEDPDAALRIAALAAEYRFTFHSDVVIDLVGYRRHGHSEVDDPTVTQPLRYAKIKDHPPLYQIYSRQIGAEIADHTKELQVELVEAQKEATVRKKMPVLHHLPEYWSHFAGGRYKAEYDVETGLTAERIGQIGERLSAYPADFHIHPKIKKLLDQRREMAGGLKPFDYGMAEAVALGSLLEQGTPVRLTGQDSQRGTFNQRHSVLVDIENEDRFIPLNHISGDQAKLEVYNSILSEAGVLGFEYGFSRDYPEALVMWEAQFGDFANGAQIIIDQFISSGEDKWGLLSGLVLLLPHGYEGQGPEHSSARIERYLQLAAHDNMQVCQPSTAAQYFHLLRRQALRSWRKPLIVFTPKSMLRHPDAVSPIADLTRSSFLNVVPDTEVHHAKRLLLCTGKIGHELRMERKKRNDQSTAIVFLDQMYPWPEAELVAEFARHPEAHEIVWVQEEPANMGALWFVMPRLKRITGERALLSVKRSGAASPATGSAKAHDLEQNTLINLALGLKEE